MSIYDLNTVSRKEYLHGQQANTSLSDASLERKMVDKVLAVHKTLESDLAFFFIFCQQEKKLTVYHSFRQESEPLWKKIQWEINDEITELISSDDSVYLEENMNRLLIPMLNKGEFSSITVLRKKLSNEKIGILGVASFEQHEYDDVQTTMLEAMADNITLLWVNKDLTESYAQISKEMDGLNRFSKYLSSHTVDMEIVLEQILDELKEIINVESCGILLYDEKKKELVLQKPSFGSKDDKFEAYSLSTLATDEERIGVAAKVFLTGEPYICNKVDQDPITNYKIAQLYGVRNSLTVPLVVDSERIGVLHAINKKKGSFASRDVRLLQLLAYQIAIVIGNIRLFKQIDNKNDLLRHSMDIHSQLTKLVLKNKSLDEITGRFGQLIGRDVIVQDQFFKVLSTSLIKEDEKVTLVENSMSEELWKDKKFKKIIDKLSNSKQPTIIPPCPEKGVERSRLIAPITLANNILGFVSILEDEQSELGEVHFLAIEHAVTVYTLKMMQQKIAYDVEESIKGDFLDDLLNGYYHSTNDIIQRATYLGHDLLMPHQVMVIDIDDFSKYVEKQQGNEQHLSKFKRRLFEIVNNCLDERLPSCMVGNKSDTIVVVAPYPDKKDFPEPEEVAGYLKKRIRNILSDITVSVGIGRVCSNVEDIKISYKEAKRAISIAKKFDKKDQVISYDSLGVYKILFTVKNEAELHNFSRLTLGPLIEYDQERNGNLVETLKNYLAHNCNNKKTADSTYIHLNTLKYRLQKIQDILDVDLNDIEERLNLQIALKVSEIKNL